MTQKYYGTKAITAYEQRNSDDEDGYAVIYEDGYTSWSPKAVFEAAYQPITAMSFSHALVALEAGLRVARAGWNGKDMWLAMSGGLEGHVIGHDKFWSPHNAEFAKSQPNGEAKVLPSITMKTATGEILMGWLASQTDMFAKDWQVVE